MIYGEPFDFAIQFDVVDCWTDPDGYWLNGMFCMFVDGRRMVEAVEVTELKVAVNFYAKMELDRVIDGDPEITAENLFKTAHDYFFCGGAHLISSVQDLTCTYLSDFGCFIYFQQLTNSDRLVWSCDFGKTVHEKIMSVGTVINVVKSIGAL